MHLCDGETKPSRQNNNGSRKDYAAALSQEKLLLTDGCDNGSSCILLKLPPAGVDWEWFVNDGFFIAEDNKVYHGSDPAC